MASARRQRARIVADVHERASGIPAYLEALGFEVELGPLPAGDYALAAETLVERKTVADLHGSIVRGRLWQQLNRLRASCSFPYLLVEGTDIDAGPLHPNSVRGACLAAVDRGIALLRTVDQTDSARWLHRLALRAQEHEAGPDRVRPGGRLQPKLGLGEDAPAVLLATIPGISSASAARLLARFGSLAAIASASYEELAAVPGIGERRAAAVLAAFTGQDAPAPAGRS